MPKTDTPSAETIAFHVPQPLLREAEEMAQIEGWKLAEFHRLCWEAGLAIQAEKSNKRLVNKGLRAKQKDKPQEIIDHSVSITLEELRMRVEKAELEGLTAITLRERKKTLD